jgi:hypothetical protein
MTIDFVTFGTSYTVILHLICGFAQIMILDLENMTNSHC